MKDKKIKVKDMTGSKTNKFMLMNIKITPNFARIDKSRITSQKKHQLDVSMYIIHNIPNLSCHVRARHHMLHSAAVLLTREICSSKCSGLFVQVHGKQLGASPWYVRSGMYKEDQNLRAKNNQVSLLP